MKKRFPSIVLPLLAIGALGWALWLGFGHRHEAEPDEHAAGEVEKKGEQEVMLEKEKLEALGIEKAQPQRAELKPQRKAFGRVLDPTPLVTLDDELASADAALAASRAEHERTQKLLASGENTSRKIAETAEAQFRTDEAKQAGLRRRMVIEWGPSFAELDTKQRHEFVERLVHAEASIVRVDLLPGDALADTPRAARLLVLGREEQPVETQSISPAGDVDPKTQAQGFVLRVDHPRFPLRPGMALTAWLELAEEARAGFAIPRAAVLRHDGRTWVYVEDEGKFLRKPVTLDSPLDGEKGWFVAAEGGGVKTEDQLVIAGAQTLLSEELKAQGGAEPD